MLRLEAEANPGFVGFNAVKTLQNSTSKALLIYSEDDHLCKKNHYDMLKEGLEGRENVTFLLCDNKGHNPNYTENAVRLLNEFTVARAKLLKKKKSRKLMLHS